MKKILIALCAVATLASCTKNEVLSYDQEAIGFENAFVDNSTRSVDDPSFANTAQKIFSDFAVYGFVEGASVFDRVKVSKSITGENTTVWTYTNTQYWINGANYDFYAIAPFTGNWAIKTGTTPTDTGAIITFTNGKVLDNGNLEPGTQDLLYAGIVERVGAASNNAAVALTFNHILSKVKFSFVNGYNASSATICVRDIKITNAYKTADATLAKDNAETTNVNEAITWSNHSGAGDIVIAFGNATTEAAYATHKPADTDKVRAYAYAYNTTVESYYERFVIPAAAPADDWNITFTVDLLVSGQVIKTYNHTAKLDTTFEPGKAYDITATITATNIDPTTSQEPIEFTANMNDWTAAVNDEATVVDPNSPQQGNN